MMLVVWWRHLHNHMQMDICKERGYRVLFFFRHRSVINSFFERRTIRSTLLPHFTVMIAKLSTLYPYSGNLILETLGWP